jgi:hypothetical protein
MNYPTLSQGARLTAVHLKNTAGDEIGKIIEWLMDVELGKVIYVVAELNNQGDYYAIPWQIMKADLQNGGYVIDQQQIEKHDIRVERGALSNLVNDKQFLTTLFEAYNINAYSEQNQQNDARTPSGPNNDERQKPQGDTYPSNAEVSEGKGYGG